ncbi:MAG: GNAT family N-acetyltransferase [Pseudoalteromonas sp.]|uniref:GNAT family N-acetyltransferase n=1 Tax=Pseudoalteromonas TaxID=53246 RepID=UPI001787ECCD|nr:GNAT family N-acetyltransferase [Pseudoalteromonas nigrifaciens]MBE0421872.1 acetyltransferase [Pseudoalteromonas nigrifaciens]
MNSCNHAEVSKSFASQCQARINTDAFAIDDFRFYIYQTQNHFSLLNSWLAQDYAHFWGMQHMNAEQRQSELAPASHKLALIAYQDATPAFFIELYEPQFGEIGKHFETHPGDCGMHLLLAPVITPQSGFSRRAITATAKLILSKLGFTRLVVEPDINNQKVHKLNKKIGIQSSHIVRLTHKDAWLGFADLASFEAATTQGD